VTTLGSSATLAQAYTASSVAADPSTLSLEIIDPEGVSDTLAWPMTPDPEVLTRLGTGSFTYTFTPAMAGVYRFRWLATGTGIVPQAADGTLEVTSAFAPQTYATLARTLALFETQPNAARQARLSTALGTATNELIEELGGRDYFRHPISGTETWSPSRLHIDGPVIHCHGGVLALASVSIDGTALGVTEYELTGSSPDAPLNASDPPFHIVLTNRRARWPADPSRITIVSARGWASIPSALAESCAARARQIVYGDASYSGSMPGADEYNAGGGFVNERWPQVLWRFMARERNRFAACLFANDDGAR
jgi:hypothetical protein